MLKKSKVVALLVVCVMMFAAVEPALAWWGEDTLYGAYKGGTRFGFLGAAIGAVVGVVAVGAVVVTGGFAGVPLMAAATELAVLTGVGATGGAAMGGVAGGVAGAVSGAAAGLLDGKEAVDKVTDDIDQNPGEFAKEMAKEAVKGLIIGTVTGQFTTSDTKTTK